MPRRSKVMPLEKAVSSLIPQNAFLAVGGMHLHNCPMAVVREVVRQNRRVSRLAMSPSASMNADLLIGAGLVDEVQTAYIGFEHLGLAPNFRRAVEGGKVKVREMDEGSLVYGYRAAAGGLPFIPYPSGPEMADVHKVNPHDYQFTRDPFTGKEVLCAAPVAPEVAVVHCSVADEYGNANFGGSVFTDLAMLTASKKVILQVERMLPHGKVLEKAHLPGFLVSAVVAAPHGCHPSSSHGHYQADYEHAKEYLELSKAAPDPYLDKYIRGKGEEEYLKAIGHERLKRLEVA